MGTRATAIANDPPPHAPYHDPVHVHVLYHLVATTVKVITFAPELDLDPYHALRALKVGNGVIVEGQDPHRGADTDIAAVETGGPNQDLALLDRVKGGVGVMGGEA